jgi:hypothetical protein
VPLQAIDSILLCISFRRHRFLFDLDSPIARRPRYFPGPLKPGLVCDAISDLSLSCTLSFSLSPAPYHHTASSLHRCLCAVVSRHFLPSHLIQARFIFRFLSSVSELSVRCVWWRGVRNAEREVSKGDAMEMERLSAILQSSHAHIAKADSSFSVVSEPHLLLYLPSIPPQKCPRPKFSSVRRLAAG